MWGHAWIVAAALILAAAPTSGPAMAQGGTAPKTGVPSGDAPGQIPSLGDREEQFARQAARTLATEVDASRIGAERASDPAVSAYARSLVERYGRAERELTQAAREAGVTLPDSAGQEGKNIVQRLDDAEGQEFDITWLTHRVAQQQKLVGMYETESKADPNSPLGRHAAELLPDLRNNLQQAEAMQMRLTDRRQTR